MNTPAICFGERILFFDYDNTGADTLDAVCFQLLLHSTNYGRTTYDGVIGWRLNSLFTHEQYLEMPPEQRVSMFDVDKTYVMQVIPDNYDEKQVAAIQTANILLPYTDYINAQFFEFLFHQQEDPYLWPLRDWAINQYSEIPDRK